MDEYIINASAHTCYRMYVTSFDVGFAVGMMPVKFLLLAYNYHSSNKMCYRAASKRLFELQ